MKKSFKHIKLPQYRRGDFGYSCATCKYMQSPTQFYCTKYNLEIDPGALCNAWDSQFSSSKDENS